MRLLFASDLHGSELVLRKAMTEAERACVDVLFIGGDLSGKFLTPVVHSGSSVVWEDPVSGVERREPGARVERILRRVADLGGYGIVLPPEALRLFDEEAYAEATIVRLASERIAAWVDALDAFSRRTGIQVMIAAGNDDASEVDALLALSPHVHDCERCAANFMGYQFMANSAVPPTPWRTPRELDEARLHARLVAAASAGDPELPIIFNAHCPPFGSGLDRAPLLDENARPIVLGGIQQTEAVGSRAVRHFLEQTPAVVLALHGHIHEGGGFTRIGGTLCLNPGSDYGRGVLWCWLVQLKDRRVVAFERLQR